MVLSASLPRTGTPGPLTSFKSSGFDSPVINGGFEARYPEVHHELILIDQSQLPPRRAEAFGKGGPFGSPASMLSSMRRPAYRGFSTR